MQKQKPILQSLSIDQLIRGKFQPRQHFDLQKLKELAASLKNTDSLLQPIIVRPIKNGLYEIVAGERRWRAAQLAQFSNVSCLVCHYTDEQALQASIIENTNRADLNPIEEAQAYQRLIDDFNYSHEEIAASVSKSRTAVTNILRLLKLDTHIQALLINGELTEGHGKILAGLDRKQQLLLAEICVQKNWSVRKLEIEAKKLHETLSAEKNTYSDANIQRLETALSEHIGNRVQVLYENQGGGYLHIRFNNIDELQGHFKRIGFEPEQ